ncbi:damage-inducible protein, partial [Candidatus Parcubacteria bacterium]
TYAEHSTATNKNSLYDSYIRAIRWASDRIGQEGVIGFVTNGSFIDSNVADGLRKCLADEFSHLYVFSLRGNQRTSGEESRKEGGKIFGSGSRAPIAITLMVKDPSHTGPCELYYHDIGDYLSREEKLAIIENAASIEGLEWRRITPNEEGDWINQRDPAFDRFIALGDKSGEEEGKVVFEVYSSGVKTNRDAWVYNFSRDKVASNMRRMIEAYNEEVEKYQKACEGLPKDQWPRPQDVVSTDPKRISWSGNLLTGVGKGQRIHQQTALAESMYRPFSKQWLYYDRFLNERSYQMPKIFPTPELENVVISVTGIGAAKPFSALITDAIPNLHMHDTGQCFPMYWYEKIEVPALGEQGSLAMEMPGQQSLGLKQGEYVRHEA